MKIKTPKWISELLNKSNDNEIFLFNKLDKEKVTYSKEIIDKISSIFYLKDLKLIVLNGINYLVYKKLNNGKFKKVNSIKVLINGKPSEKVYKFENGVLNIMSFAYGYDIFKGKDFNGINYDNKTFILMSVTVYDRKGENNNSNIRYEFRDINDKNLLVTLNSSKIDKEISSLKLSKTDSKLDKYDKLRIKAMNDYKKSGKPKLFIGDIVVGFPNKDLSEVDIDPDFYGVVNSVRITFSENIYDNTKGFQIEYLISWNGLSVWLSEWRVEGVGFNSENIDYDKLDYVMKKHYLEQKDKSWQFSHPIHEHPFRYGSFFDTILDK